MLPAVAYVVPVVELPNVEYVELILPVTFPVRLPVTFPFRGPTRLPDVTLDVKLADV